MSAQGPSEQGGRDRRSRQGPKGASPRERTWPTLRDSQAASGAMRPRSQARIAQVQFCNVDLKTGYFPEEEEHVAAYLNLTYYKFTP